MATIPSSSPGRPSVRAAVRKSYSLAQANRALPLVSRIVADIVTAHAEAMSIQQHITDEADRKKVPPLREQLGKLHDRLEALLVELKELGIELKDYRIGLIDFPGLHQGRPVCLCWKLGEPAVAYWHEIHTGFTGRQPVSTLDETV